MAAEEVLQLFYSYWFERLIFSKKPVPSPLSEKTPLLKIHGETEEPKVSRLPTLHVRSLSEQNLSFQTSFYGSDSSSPYSIFTPPKLQTILSEKEITEFHGGGVEQEGTSFPLPRKKKLQERRRKIGISKSLSDLEFEELKGFMDLGFVFSEEDRDSSLVSIIPGLQRLGKCGENGREEEIDQSDVQRPYLSEAWDILDRRKKENPLMNWRIPALGNEMDMKDHLKFWAQTVASTVR